MLEDIAIVAIHEGHLAPTNFKTTSGSPTK